MRARGHLQDVSAPDDAATSEERFEGAAPDELQHEFVELGLSPYEAKVLLALLRLGSANTIQLARLSGVPRTSSYQVLEALSAKRLAERLPGDRPAVWASPSRELVMQRLEEALAAAQEERLQQHRDRATRVQRLLADSYPQSASVALPYVHIIHGATQVKKTYDQLLGAAEREMVMFTRSPYAYAVGAPNPAVMQMLERGVSCRVLYEAAQWRDPSAHAFRNEMHAYHTAGVEARLTATLPIKLVVVDRTCSLVAMIDPVAPEAGYPTNLLIEHPGYAEVQIVAFDKLWDDAEPV